MLKESMSYKNAGLRFFIRTFGCQMNKSDSELMEFSLKKSGFKKANDQQDADIIIYNTCSVRQHAEDRAIARIKSEKDNPVNCEKVIVIAGCMAQRIGEELIEKKIADLAVGPYQSPGIGEIINTLLNTREKKIYTSQSPVDFKSRINPELSGYKDSLHWHKWVAITHGCNNFCSYCIVPHVRGPLISFPSDSIIEYIKKLASNGINEISLLGQNVNQYGMDRADIPFSKLLDRCANIDGLIKINYLTSHPGDFNDDIIFVIRDNENISRSVHLPLQSGSDNILELMNRGYSIKHYLNIVEKIDKHLDDYSISTDFIVGFPGETGDDFRSTLDAVEKVRFDDAFMYAYSSRDSASAYNLTESLSRPQKLDRLNTLIDIQRNISREKLKKRINRIEETIIERLSKKSKKEVMGRTFLNHPVVIPGSEEDIGKKIKVKISSLKGSTLYGKPIT